MNAIATSPREMGKTLGEKARRAIEANTRPVAFSHAPRDLVPLTVHGHDDGAGRYRIHVEAESPELGAVDFAIDAAAGRIILGKQSADLRAFEQMLTDACRSVRRLKAAAVAAQSEQKETPRPFPAARVLRAKAMHALGRTGVDDGAIGIAASNGVVTVTGLFNAQAERRAVLEATARVPQARAIADER